MTTKNMDTITPIGLRIRLQAMRGYTLADKYNAIRARLADREALDDIRDDARKFRTQEEIDRARREARNILLGVVSSLALCIAIWRLW